MAKPTPLTDDELKALTDAEMRSAVGYYGGKLAGQRQKAEYYYLGLAKGDLAPPEVEGRSTVVSPVVRNTIESMLPQLMAKFTGGDTVVEFEPTQRNDEQAATNCTNYLNYLFFKKNNGHNVSYTWFKDALLQKVGIIKVWWDERDEETREDYKGLTQVELAQIMDDPEVEVTEQATRPDEEDAKQRQEAIQQITQQMQQAMQAAQQPGPQQQQAAQAVQQMQAHLQGIQAQPPALLYDITCKRTKSGGKITIENVPPEEFLISRKAKNIATAPFVAHRVARTLSELRTMGYKNVDAIESDDAAVALNAERIERLSFDDEMAYLNVNEAGSDESQRQVWVTECYIRCDYDGDGIAELRKVCRAGNQILSNEIVDAVPFVGICPVPMPHKFFGLSIADLAMEGQKTETAILRATLDNTYLEVNGRYFAVEGQVNLDDLLMSRPGGVVRMKAPNMAGRLDQGKGNLADSMQMLEYMKGFNEDSTGWTRQSQGNDASGFNPETATKANIVTNKADMRTDLVARNFAEGFVELFRMMLKLESQHRNKSVEVKLSGQWVDMDPREWRNMFDVSINVGLGVGNKDQQVQHLMMLQQAQGHGLQIGITTPENIYNSSLELAKNMGFKSGDKFFTKPDPNKPPPNPQAGEMQMKQMELQAQGQMHAAELQQKAQMAQVEAQFKQQTEAADREHEAQLEQLRAQMQQQVDMNRDRSQAEQETLKQQQAAQLAQLEAQYKDAAHQREQGMEWQKAQLEAATKIEVANIMSQAKVKDAATDAATARVAADE